MTSLTSEELSHRIEKAGYYPALVSDTLAIALADEGAVAHLVHSETTFDTDTVRRHLSVLALTPTRLVLVHVDDHSPEMLAQAGLGDLAFAEDAMPDAEHLGGPHAVATSEAVGLASVRSVMVTHVVADPAHYRHGELGREITLTIGWGAISRIDLESASCGDPHCEADHGYTGSITGDDLSIRIAAEADGPKAVGEALAFARALSAATAHR
ncbi:MAG: DUF5998 family protein [Nakamurella sp.]